MNKSKLMILPIFFYWIIIFSCAAIAQEEVTTDTSIISDKLEKLKTLKKEGNYTEAESFAKELLREIEANYGPESLEAAAIMDQLVGALSFGGKADQVESRELAEKAIEIKKKHFPPDHIEVTTSQSNYAVLLWFAGDYAEAKSILKQILPIREKEFGPDHQEVAKITGNLGILSEATGDYIQAKYYDERTLKIFENLYGPEDINVAMVLDNFSIVLQKLGDYERARELAERALSIFINTLGPIHPEVSKSHDNLSEILIGMGEYAMARWHVDRALEIREKTLDPDHPLIAQSLKNIARLLIIMRDYSNARLLIERALEIEEKNLGRYHDVRAFTLSILANLAQRRGDYNKARELKEEALTIVETIHGLDNIESVPRMIDLAGLLRETGEYTQARLLYERALTIREKAYGSENVWVALSLNDLADFYYGQKIYHEASLLINRAIKIWDSTPTYPYDRIKAYVLRARLLKQQKDLDGALTDLAEALRSTEEVRPKIGGGEETRARFFEQYTEFFNLMVSWQIEAGNLEKAVEYAEQGRARVLLEQLAAGKIDLRSSIPSDIRAPLIKRETDAKARLAEYQQRITFTRSRKNISDQEKKNQILALEDSLREADSEFQHVYEEIKNASPLWRDLITSGGQPVPLATIQRELVSENGFMLLYQIGEEESHLFVIPSVGQKPGVFPLRISEEDTSVLKVEPGLLTSKKLENILVGSNSTESSTGLLVLLKMNPNLLQAGQEKILTTKLQALWRMLMPDVIWPKVKQCAEVIIVPDDMLNLLPFEALVVQSGESPVETRYWIDEGPVVRYAPSATILYSLEKRQIVKVPPRTAEPFILSLSDPIFDIELVESEFQKQLSTKPQAYEDSTSEQSPGILEMLSAVTRSEELEQLGPLPRLPGTAIETDYIRQYFGSKNVKALQQFQADEPNLRANIRGKRYVHLATHGIVELQRSSLSNAMALTLSPKNIVDSQNDGFLRLYEIYELKLPECELTVLSACDTQFGRLFESEGVFALSRGFLAAGATRVVASHWQVQDISTAELIGAFFRSIATSEKNDNTIDFALALRDAKLKLRRDKNRRQWAAPYFWAPFIITGKK